jgi:putative chitobiose transport system substrate-binding protein
MWRQPMMIRGQSYLIWVVCVSAMAGVSHPSLAASQIEFWTMQLSPFHDAYINGVIEKFERAHPGISVKWVDVPWSEMEKKTLAAVAASRSQLPPDVVNLNPQFASKLAEFGALAEPEKYLSAAEIAGYLPAAWRANQLDGKTFALPWYLTTNILLYNKELLTRAGVQPPATYDALLLASRKIRDATGAYAYFPALDGSTPLETLVAMGGTMLAANGCGAGFINTDGERIFSHYQTLYGEGLVPRNVVTEGHRKAVEMFLAGQIAMITTGTQFMQTIKNGNAELYKKIGVAPQIGHGQNIPANIAAMNVAVLEASKNKTNAFRFAQFITNAENQTAFAQRVPIFPSSVSSYQHPYFSALGDDALLNEAKALSIEQVLHGAVLVPPMRRYSKFKSSYARGVQSVMLGRQSVREALGTIERDWPPLLGCNKQVSLKIRE